MLLIIKKTNIIDIYFLREEVRLIIMVGQANAARSSQWLVKRIAYFPFKGI